MLCVLMIHIVMDMIEITISMVNYLLYVIIIILIYGIKMIRKMSINLTNSRRSLHASKQLPC
jgi:DMSO/TMAO reductase YedYZ heme-binding membrane subunit